VPASYPGRGEDACYETTKPGEGETLKTASPIVRSLSVLMVIALIAHFGSESAGRVPDGSPRYYINALQGGKL